MIDVRKEMGATKEKDNNLFIQKQPADKFAAAERLAITEKLFREWYDGINRTNTREMPKDLVKKYEEACMCMCEILTMERRLIIKSE